MQTASADMGTHALSAVSPPARGYIKNSQKKIADRYHNCPASGALHIAAIDCEPTSGLNSGLRVSA